MRRMIAPEIEGQAQGRRQGRARVGASRILIARPRLLALLASILAVVAVVVHLSFADGTRALGPKLPSAAPATSGSPSASMDVVHVQVEHTLFHPMNNVVLVVERMDGRLVGMRGQTISLDDHSSFSVQIDQAVTRLAARDLSNLINSYLLQRADSAIRHVDISFDGQRVVLKGQVHKLLTLPFEGRGVLSATPQGELRMHMEEFRVAGVLNRSFLSFFGIRLDDVAQPQHKASFRVEGDDFITSLNELFPAPRVYGHLTRVHVEKQDLVQVIGSEPAQHPTPSLPQALPEPANYIHFTGGRMRFGRVTMDNVELMMVNRTPQASFDFSLDHYQEQIQAGYVRVTPEQGLVVYAQSWGTLPAGHRN